MESYGSLSLREGKRGSLSEFRMSVPVSFLFLYIRGRGDDLLRSRKLLWRSIEFFFLLVLILSCKRIFDTSFIGSLAITCARRSYITLHYYGIRNLNRATFIE